MTDADWFEALSPEVQNIVFVIESSIARSGRVPLDSERPQKRIFYISYLSQDALYEIEEVVKIVAGPYWGVPRIFESYLSAGDTLLPKEMAETILSAINTEEEVPSVARVVVSPSADWAKGVLGSIIKEETFQFSLIEEIIEAIAYYEVSGQQDYSYSWALLREILRCSPTYYIQEVHEKFVECDPRITRIAFDGLYYNRPMSER